MNFVFLSPHFPPNYYLFCQGLKKEGANILAIGDCNYEQLSQELKNSITEYYKVSNQENYDELLRAVAWFTHKHGKIDRLESLNEYWLEHEARLRTDFNISGRNLDTIKDIKYKTNMKKLFKKAGLKPAAGKVCKNLNEAVRFAKKAGFPIIAKPDKGVGASDTHKFNNADDLKPFFEKELPCDYIFEQYIEGDIYTFDGISDANCVPLLYTSHMYESVMDIVNEKKNVFIISLREIPESLREQGFKVVKQFQAAHTFFHLEFFRTPDGEFVPMEVNMRPPGGYMPDMINYANDINIYHEWAKIIMHGATETVLSRKYFCSFTSRRYDGRKYAHTHEEILNKFGKEIVMHAEIPAIFSGAMGNYVYLARNENEQYLRELNQFIIE